MTSRRVAEFRAIFFLSGWSSAVIDSTARRTSSALTQAEDQADPEEHPEEDLAGERRRPDRQRRQGEAYDEQTHRPEGHGWKHQRRILRWRRH